jgi:hypothetical protein
VQTVTWLVDLVEEHSHQQIQSEADNIDIVDNPLKDRCRMLYGMRIFEWPQVGCIDHELGLSAKLGTHTR